jgi:hypothetical protein
MRKAGKVFVSCLEGVGVYFCTFLGILLAQYAPLLMKQGSVDTTVEWVRLGLSAGIAFYVLAVEEGKGDEEGRRRNLKKRLCHAFTSGYAFNGLLGLAGQAVGG